MKKEFIYYYHDNGIFSHELPATYDFNDGTINVPAYATTKKPLGAVLPALDIFDGNKWLIFTPSMPEKPTIEQQRAGMVMSNAQARLKLINLGLFDAIDKAILSMPRNAPLYVLWEYGADFHRTDEHLIAFCTNTLKMTAEEIDALFI